MLTKVGKAHFGLSAGLVVGGKDFDEEKTAITSMNILVATPGRLLQVLGHNATLLCNLAKAHPHCEWLCVRVCVASGANPRI